MIDSCRHFFTVDEIKKINTHIRDWNNLLPGTKLRLPEISDMLNDEIDNVEPFIEEYYPRIEKDIYNKEEPIIDLNKTYLLNVNS